MDRQEIHETPDARMVENILAVWYGSNEAERQEGSVWYENAREVTHKLAERYGLTQRRAAAVISILSPSCRWDQNVEDAETILSAWSSGLDFEDFTVSTYNQNKHKAWDLLHEPERDPGEYFTNRAPKTRAFWRALADEPGAPVIDGHTVAIAMGERQPLDRTPDIRGAPYRRIAAAITEAAQRVGVQPEVIQATVWIAWRNTHLEPRYRGGSEGGFPWS